MYYRPDPSIVRRLKECDPDLDVRWHDGRGRWIVTCMGKDAITVQEPDGSYRPLDGRIVTRMREEAWTYRHRFGQFHMVDREIAVRNWEAEQRRKAAERDNFRQYAVEEMYPRVFGVGGVSGRSKFTGWSNRA